MTGIKETIKHSPFWQGTLLTALLLLALYPELWVFQRSVMSPGTWELQDPAVSSLVYVPGVRAIRRELFTNGNLLWSSLRSTGMPILGNEVQAAPLFPLSPLLFLPEPYCWNIFVFARLFCIGVVVFLLAREIFALSLAGAITFVITGAFSVHVLRWSNHAWQSGFLAGLVYIYFLYRAFRSETKIINLGNGVGVALGAYSLFTCGFPESALMMSFLVLFLIGPKAIRRMVKPGGSRILLTLLFLHVVAFGLASPQWMGLVDFIGEQPLGFRAGPGRYQYEGVQVLLRWITRVTDGPPQGEAIHYFNLIPLTLFGVGMASAWRKKTRTTSCAMLIALVFFFLKNFPVWAAFNSWIAKIPIAASSWFTVYSLALVILPFAYFCARGIETISHATSIRRVLWLSPFACLAFALVFFSCELQDVDFSTRAAKLVLLLVVFCASIGVAKQQAIVWITGAMLFLELASVRPTHFRKLDEKTYHREMSHVWSKEVAALLHKRGHALQNVREISGGGLFVSAGIATFNNGSPPIVPLRYRKLIDTLFYDVAGWGPHLPVTLQQFPFSWQLVGVTHYFGLDLTSPTPLADERRLIRIGEVSGEPLYEDERALGRAYLASDCLASDGMEMSQRLLRTVYRQPGTVVLETSPQGQELCKRLKQKVKRILVLKDEGSRVELERVRGPGILVLNDQYYKDWAVVDTLSGERLEIVPANLAFRGVTLQKDRAYQLMFTYHPRWLASVQWAIGLSVVSFLLWAWRYHQFAWPGKR